MKNRAFRVIAVTLSLLLMLAVPAQASPVQINDVVQVVSGSQRSGGGQNVSVQLRFLSQDDNATAGSTTTSASDGSVSGNTSSSGVTTSQDPTGGAIIQTDVTEDIGVEECECGPFTVPVAGFPKWPFIPLVGLVCLVPDLCTKCTPKEGQNSDCKNITIPDCTTTGTCPQVPEPASLLLFGSGMAALGASLRRRRAHLKDVQAQAATISGSK